MSSIRVRVRRQRGRKGWTSPQGLPLELRDLEVVRAKATLGADGPPTAGPRGQREA